MADTGLRQLTDRGDSWGQYKMDEDGCWEPYKINVQYWMELPKGPDDGSDQS